MRLRGYAIDYSVEIGKSALLFQSHKCAIKIDRNAVIGSGTRIKAGFKGRIWIGENVLVDDYSFISSHNSIEIGSGTMVSASSYIVDFNHKYPLSEFRDLAESEKGYISKSIKIGNNVWIGTHVVILPGVIIGDGSVIGAGSIVTKSVPSFCIAVGNPAKVIKKLNNLSLQVKH